MNKSHLVMSGYAATSMGNICGVNEITTSIKVLLINNVSFKAQTELGGPADPTSSWRKALLCFGVRSHTLH